VPAASQAGKAAQTPAGSARCRPSVPHTCCTSIPHAAVPPPCRAGHDGGPCRRHGGRRRAGAGARCRPRRPVCCGPPAAPCPSRRPAASRTPAVPQPVPAGRRPLAAGPAAREAPRTAGTGHRFARAPEVRVSAAKTSGARAADGTPNRPYGLIRGESVSFDGHPRAGPDAPRIPAMPRRCPGIPGHRRGMAGGAGPGGQRPLPRAQRTDCTCQWCPGRRTGLFRTGRHCRPGGRRSASPPVNGVRTAAPGRPAAGSRGVTGGGACAARGRCAPP